jgi:hypothetical protein
MGFHLNFTDDQVHQVAFYVQSWSRRNPWAEFHAVDAVSKVSLDQRRFENFDEGAYLIYNVKRQVYFEITPPNILTNVEVYGVFIDPVRVFPLQIRPPPGEFVGRAHVTLVTLTPNAEIFYTLDGSEPSRQSARYSGPLTLHSTARVRARAFRDGFEPSPLAEAEYVNNLPNLSAFIAWDSQTAGNWMGKYGSEGIWLAMSDPGLPSYVEAWLADAAPWSWDDQSSDPRALLANHSGDLRQARTWFANEAIHLTLGIYDTQMHAVSLYFVDYDGRARTQEIQVLDLTGEVRERFRLEAFQGGRYLTLAVQGITGLRIQRLEGPNVVLSGIFLDAAPPPLSFVEPSPLSNLRWTANGLIEFSVAGLPGLRICTDRSADLRTWECSSTNEMKATTARLSVPFDDLDTRRFFRTHFVP